MIVTGTSVEPSKEVIRKSKYFSEDNDWLFYDLETGEPLSYNDIVELDDEDRPRAIFINLVRSGEYKDLVGNVTIDNVTVDHYNNFINADPNNINKLLNLLEPAREVYKEYLLDLEKKYEEFRKQYEEKSKL